jgi:hypothetical protein
MGASDADCRTATQEKGRADMLGWLVKNVEASSAAPITELKLGCLVSPVLACLLDRNAGVRLLAEQMYADQPCACSVMHVPCTVRCILAYVFDGGGLVRLCFCFCFCFCFCPRPGSPSPWRPRACPP